MRTRDSMRSVAFCVSDPGISNSSRSDPPTVMTRRTRRTRMPTQPRMIRHGCIAQIRVHRASPPDERRSCAARRSASGASTPLVSSPTSCSVMPSPSSFPDTKDPCRAWNSSLSGKRLRLPVSIGVPWRLGSLLAERPRGSRSKTTQPPTRHLRRFNNGRQSFRISPASRTTIDGSHWPPIVENARTPVRAIEWGTCETYCRSSGSGRFGRSDRGNACCRGARPSPAPAAD